MQESYKVIHKVLGTYLQLKYEDFAKLLTSYCIKVLTGLY